MWAYKLKPHRYLKPFKSYCRLRFSGRHLGFPVEGGVRFFRGWHHWKARTRKWGVDTGIVSLSGRWAKLEGRGCKFAPPLLALQKGSAVRGLTPDEVPTKVRNIPKYLSTKVPKSRERKPRLPVINNYSKDYTDGTRRSICNDVLHHLPTIHKGHRTIRQSRSCWTQTALWKPSPYARHEAVKKVIGTSVHCTGTR